MTVTDKKVKVHKISLEKLGPLKLTKKPFVRLEKVHVPDHLLSELKKKYLVGGGTFRKKVKFVDDEIDLIKEAQAEQGKKRKKLKVRVVQDSQTVVIEEISRHDCVFQGKPPDVKSSPKRSIRDVRELHSVRKPVRRLERALRYLKPSKTADNYGLGGKAEIDRDDVDQPLKQIPLWAEERNYLEQMSSQADVEADRIFAVPEPPNMKEIFPTSTSNKYNQRICWSSSLDCHGGW